MTAAEALKLARADRAGELFKYVRVGNEFRFCVLTLLDAAEHRQLLGANEIADSAGTIALFGDGRVKFIDRGSQTCQCGCDETAEALTELFKSLTNEKDKS